MLTWSELLVGLIPFLLAGFLFWLRLRAVKASGEVIRRLIVSLIAFVLMALFGIALAAKGWHDGNLALLVIGAMIGVWGFMALRRKLGRIWEQFPLTVEDLEGEMKMKP